MKVEGKTIVVTGGGNGIGRQLVLELVRRGARVAAADIRGDDLAATADLAEAGDRLVTFVVDVTDRSAVQALAGGVTSTFGEVDGLINNAGIIQPFVRFNELEFDDIERVLDVNLYGTINMLKVFLPLLLERPEAHITNLSSMGGFLPVPGQALYGASKAAVKLLSEALYAELLHTNVGVTVVMPGGVGTDIAAHSGIDTSGMSADEASYPTTSPEDAARIIIDGMEDDEMHVLVGKDARTMNLAVRVAPRQATHMITRRMKDLLG